MDEEEFHIPRLNDGDDDDDSDKELEIAYTVGKLKPGMFRPIAAPKPEINNKKGLLENLEALKQLDLDWVEKLDITVSTKHREDVEGDGEHTFDVHNDFQREISFYEQAKDAVLVAMKRLHASGIQTQRPDDYFAEMAKKDKQMKRVREKILSVQTKRETIDRNKTNFKLKKYGKQVQQAVARERRQKKKAMTTAVKKFQKGKTKKLDFLEDDPLTTGIRKKTSQFQKLQQQNKLSSKRTYKDKKFGHGGMKKGTKRNTKESYDDVSMRVKKNKHGQGARGGNKAKGGKNKRPGKNKRTAMKSR